MIFSRFLRVALSITCVVGIGIGTTMLLGYDLLSPESHGVEAHGIGDSVETDFGFVAVEHAIAISGLSATDIAGAHGVPGLVEAGTISVQVSATVTNQTTGVLHYSPTEFQLLDNSGAPIELAEAPNLPGELQPNAAIDITLAYVTTTLSRPFTVRFDNPATTSPVLIGLGDVGCTVQSGTGLPLEVEGACTAVPDRHGHDEDEPS